MFEVPDNRNIWHLAVKGLRENLSQLHPSSSIAWDSAKASSFCPSQFSVMKSLFQQFWSIFIRAILLPAGITRILPPEDTMLFKSFPARAYPKLANLLLEESFSKRIFKSYFSKILV
jgi:hypothetical protein